MILGLTIQNRLDKAHKKSVGYDFDIRYLDKWVKLYPQCFPKYILNNNYTPFFNGEKYRWEILRGKKVIKFNPQNYI